MTAAVQLPTREQIDDELASRSFPLWSERRFHILGKDQKDQLLKLNRAQRAVDGAENEEMARTGQARVYVLKGRQGGVTTWAQARALHEVMTRYGASAMTIAHDREGTDKIFDKITTYAIRRFDPRKIPRLGGKRTREITVPHLSSSFYTGTAGAEHTGIGLTMQRLHGSEFAFWKDPRATLRMVTPAMVPRGSVIVLETTASAFDSEAHQFWREARDTNSPYRAVFIPWWWCDEANYQRPLTEPDELGALEEDEQLLVKNHGLTLEEINWRRHMIDELGGRDEFFQQYPEDDESCWLAAGGMYFSGEALKALLDSAPVPTSVEMGGELEIFADRGTERVIIGVDTSEGVGEDSNTFSARAFPSWRLIRKYSNNRVQPKEFAAILNEQGRILGNAFLVVEKNMHGITVLRHLRDDHHYPEGQIYHRNVLDKARPEEGGKLGWATTEESKPIMLSAGRELLAAATKGLAGIPAKSVIRQAFAVRRGENGKYDLNGRDELVAEMLAWIGRSAPTSMGMAEHARAELEKLRAKQAQKTNGR